DESGAEQGGRRELRRGAHRNSQVVTVIERNRAVWNRMAAGGSRFAHVATDEECRQPLATLDGRGWLPVSVAGMQVLCLAAGGGWQSVLYASAGAIVTVVDLSSEMLRRDVQEATRRHLSVRVLEGAIHDL